MKYLIVPITKSPWVKGRIGSKRLQDWYLGLLKTMKLNKDNPDSKILVCTGLQVKDNESEMEIYLKELNNLNISNSEYILSKNAFETIGQIEEAQKLANELNRENIFVSTFLHYPRVRWLTRDMNAQHYVVWGIPRPKEAITDILLTFIFPIVDILGKKAWFKEIVVSRRKRGVF